MGDNGVLASYVPPKNCSEVGIENLIIQAVPDETGTSIGVAAGTGVGIDILPWTTDSWVRNVVLEGNYSSPSHPCF